MITVKNVSKKYRIYHSPADRLKEIVTRKKYHKNLQALSGISFSVANGETLGIVGENGAGKSTLLKILQGVIIPDEGKVEVTGKVTGLLELGTGFNHELTGIENIYMNGTLLGMSKDEIDSKKDEIISFTELGDAINDPIKTYSSGMLMRLGFSIAIHADPACFLVDEALSVGDAYFQQKCMRAIQAFKDKGGSIIFVSHDMNAVRTLCDRTLFIDGGIIIDYGNTKDVVDFYENKIIKKIHKGESDLLIIKDNKGEENFKSGLNTGEVELKSFKILDEDEHEISFVESEKYIKFIFEIVSKKDLEEPHYGFILRNYLGQRIFQIETDSMHIKPKKLFSNQIAVISFSMKIPLSPGRYAITIGIANKGDGFGKFEEYLLTVYDIGILNVIPKSNSILYSGIFNMNPEVEINYTD